tara:strand:+ start:153 stop:1289 length:1137 start_codon:yes stop_codon:yes gene_type:complete
MKRVLTKSSDGRWRKQIDGKMRYFGRVNPKMSLNRSYKDAELRYFEFLAEREAKHPVEVLVNKLTVEDFGEKYLQSCFTRYERGEISATWFEKIRISVCHFIDYLQTDLPLSKLNEMLLDDYRNYTLSLPISTSTNKSISLWTAKSRLDIVKLMIKWGYQMALIDQLPRNLDGFSKVSIPEPTVNRFSWEEIKLLYCEASERTKMFILLGLNCAFGQTDISDLRVREVSIEAGRITRKRSKTGVQCQYKLWLLTIEMLKLHGSFDGKPDDRVFLSAKELPLVREYFVDDKFRREDSIRRAFTRLMKKTKMPNHRGFYSLRKTAASEIEVIDPAVTEMFLAHSEKGMKRHYAERDWKRLDMAIMKLWQKFDLDDESSAI